MVLPTEQFTSIDQSHDFQWNLQTRRKITDHGGFWDRPDSVSKLDGGDRQPLFFPEQAK